MSERADAAVLRPLEPTSPFKFLDYYDENDRNLFAGRDREIRDVVAGILRARTLVLYSRSGLGKTSLLLAGVFPELVARGLRPVYVRTFDQPLADLRTALGAAGGAELRETVRAAGPGTVLVCDQFEELFIRFRDQPDVRAEFIRTVADLVNDRALDVRLVFSLREEYLAELDDFRSLLPDLFSNEYRLHPLTAFGSRQTISRALQQHGIAYEQRLLTGLVDTLEGSRYDPAILQILCYELYKETVARETSPVFLKSSDLERLGGLDGIFRRHVKSLSRALGDRRLLALVILDNMVTREQTKRAVTVGTLLDSYFIATREEVTEVLELLEMHDLIRRIERGAETFFELIHDRLVGSVQDWIKSDPQFFNLHHAAEVVATAARGEAFRKQPELLLTAGQVRTVVGDYRERLRFNDVELELLLRSAAYRRIPDVLSYWAGRFGHARSPEIVLGLLQDADPEVRRGGAEAACRVRDEDGRLAERCLELALGDDNEEVRRAAGTSLAYLRGPIQNEDLAERLRSRRTRGPALEILADFSQTTPLSKSLSWIWRKWAENIVDERRLRQNRDIIHRRAAYGALAGSSASIVFLVTCAQLFLGLVFDYSGEVKVFSLCLTLILAAGVLIGWRAAASEAKIVAVHGKSRWAWSSLRCESLPLALLAAFILFATLYQRPIYHDPTEILSRYGPWILLVHLLIAAQMPLAKFSVSPMRTVQSCWFWIAVNGLGIPFLPVLILSGRQSVYSDQNLGLLGMTWSFGFCAAASAIAYSEKKLPLGAPRELSKASCLRAQIFLLLAFAATLTLAVLRYLHQP